MIFGRRRSQPEAPAAAASPTSRAGGSGGEPPHADFDKSLPWSGFADAISCNLACGSLGHTLKQALVVDGRLHAETLIVTIGAITGFSATLAVHETLIKTGRGRMGVEYHIAETEDGTRYLLGDALNAHLLPEAPGRHSLWGLLAGTITQIGVPYKQLPSIEPVLGGVAGRLGQPDYGVIKSVGPRNQPILQPLEALNTFWPLAKQCFHATAAGGRDRGPPMIDHWSLIASFNAAQYVIEMAAVLDPKIAFLLAMESAFIASKVMPETITDGPM